MSISRLRNYLVNTALVVCSVAAFFAVLEIVVLKAFATHIPLKMQRHLGDISPIAQPTKKSVLPEDYILIVGDSFAAGTGDWLFAADHSKNPPFNSAHVLHSLTGTDVLNIGRPGFGSINTMVSAPINAFDTINASPLMTLEPPDQIWVYFYEGNDIENNVNDFFGASEKPAIDDLPKHLEETVFPRVMKEARHRLNRAIAPIENTMHVFRGFLRLLRHETKLLFGMTTDPFLNISHANRFGKEHPWLGMTLDNSIRLVDGNAGTPPLQGPGPQLEDWEIDYGAKVFESSLKFLRSRFPTSKVRTVYIPAPASIYNFEGSDVAISIQTYERPVKRFPAAFLHQRSDRICQAIAGAARTMGASFIDTRPHFRKVAETEIIHGPIDASHFNQRGHEELAKVLTGPDQHGACAISPLSPS